MPMGEDLVQRIRVLPPFWRTLWFWVPVAGLLGGVAAFLVRRHVLNLKRLNRRLEDLVEARTQELGMANLALLDQSLTDPLTGLHNRRYLDATIPGILAQTLRAHRTARAGSADRLKLNVYSLFAMVDMDHFKLVNDTFGHPAGDLVLKQVGEILVGVARNSDIVVRMGGEEFLVIARPTSAVEAHNLPERIRAAVEAHPFDIRQETPLRCTCSVGFSLFPVQAAGEEPLSWEQVLAMADHCLYEAKELGRNAWVGVVPDPDVLAAPPPGGPGREILELLASGAMKKRSFWPEGP